MVFFLPGCISALGLDGARGILAVASAAGHVSCYRLISLPHHVGERVNLDSISAGTLLGSRGPCGDNYLQNSKAASFILEVELVATLHIPFATPPKLLHFGQTSLHQVHTN